MNGILLLLSAVLGVIIFLVLFHWIIYSARRKNKFSPFTEKFLRSPGYSLGNQLDESRDSFMEPVIGLTLTPIAYLLVVGQLRTPVNVLFTVIALIALVLLGRQLVVRTAKVTSLRLGLDGEVYTGQELNYLMRSGAYVYHDIPYKYGNIDHVIVATGGIFVVETKALRKPGNAEGKRQSRVSCRDGKLYFPSFTIASPITQATRHARYLRAYLKNKTRSDVPVTPVVALPGWFIDKNDNPDLLVINPKRGSALRSYVQRANLAAAQVDVIANLIEDIARSVWAGAEKYDPDANKKYTFWLDRKREERRIE